VEPYGTSLDKNVVSQKLTPLSTFATPLESLTDTPSKMSPAKAIVTDKAPKPLPQFSSAVKYNGMVYCSGSLGLEPKTFAFVEGGVKEQTVSLITHPCV
jgi:hypothetical protein